MSSSHSHQNLSPAGQHAHQLPEYDLNDNQESQVNGKSKVAGSRKPLAPHDINDKALSTSQSTDATAALPSITKSIQLPAPQTTAGISPGWKPHSRSAIGRMSYTLDVDNLPKLTVLEIKTLVITFQDNAPAGSSASPEVPARSKALRMEAVYEFVTLRGLDKLKDKFAIDFSTGTEVDRLIIPTSLVYETKKDQELFNDAVGECDLQTTKQLSMKCQENGATSAKMTCHCSSRTVEAKDGGHLYWRCLNILMRRHANRQDTNKDKILMDTRNPPHILQHIPTDALKVTDDWQAHCNMRLRLQPQFDRITQKLNIDFDLTPVLLRKEDENLPDALLGFIQKGTYLSSDGPDQATKRTTIVDYLSAAHIQTLRHILVGLSVGYRLADTVTDAAASITMSGVSQQAASRLHLCAIQDIRLPRKVDRVYHDSKPCSVQKYFEKARGITLQHPGFPLANIGGSQPGYEKWVPLELLYLLQDEPLRDVCLTKHLLDTLPDRDNERLTQALTTKGNKFCTKVNGVCPIIPQRIQSDFIPPKGRRTQYQAPRKNLLTTPIPANASIGILHVASRCTELDRGSPNVKESVGEFAFDVKETIGRVKLLGSDREVLVATITNTSELLAKPLPPNQTLRRMVDGAPDVLLGVVDSSGRSNSDVRDIRAQLHEFGTTKMQSLVVCISKSQLERFIRSVGQNPGATFPPGHLRKMRLMLGCDDFQTSHHARLQNVMVVGAHIEHPGSNAAKHCPSVAAVVAVKPAHPSQYPGSARVQPTFLEAKRTGPGNIKFIVESSIVELKELMQERFQLWHDTANAIPPSCVLFYRDAIDLDSANTIADKEQRAIKDAFKNVFSRTKTDVNVTYVVVSNNTDIQDVKRWGSSEKNIKSVDKTDHEFQNMKNQRLAEITGFTAVQKRKEHNAETSNNAEYEPGSHLNPHAKYQYYVIGQDEGNFGPEILGQITGDLNASFPLGRQVGYALPLYWAKRLSHRVFDYIPWAAHDRWSQTPGIMAVARFDMEEDDKNSKLYAEVIQKYFSGTVPPISASSRSLGTSRQVPWPAKFDDKMFYL